MNNLEQVAEEATKKFPHYRTYAKCQSQAFMKGILTFFAGFAGSYLAQEFVRKRRLIGGIDRKVILLSSLLIGAAGSYATTRHETKNCQEMWLVLEDKYTNLTPGGGRLKQVSETESESER
ncbi:transmembrane protein 141-like [Tubulanus polymorphus]|uniref:transmembrane protein 141-like n=1 Tax=Tubulanus polymorphus TaxID=672921 RepID=UPI003DA26F89